MAHRITSMDELQQRIAELQVKQQEQATALRQSTIHIIETLSPSHLLNDALKNITKSPELRNNVMDTALGIGAGVLSKKLFVGGSRNIIKKIGGTAIEFLVANIIRKRIPKIREEAAEATTQ